MVAFILIQARSILKQTRARSAAGLTDTDGGGATGPAFNFVILIATGDYIVSNSTG